MKYLLSASLSAVASLITASQAADAPMMTLRSTEIRTALLELYTSEGCSSCPPAEVWISRLKQSPGLWRDFVPVAFHVDYWGYLGWRDPWGAREFSDRQRDYASAWKSSSVYTPEFVLNGGEWRGWRAGDSVPSSKDRVGVLQAASADNRQWEIEFKPTTAVARYVAHAALLGSGLISDVKAGENSGRRLAHDFTVLSLAKAPLAIQSGALKVTVALPPSKSRAEQLGIAVWVTADGQIEPLQAVGGWLPATAGK